MANGCFRLLNKDNETKAASAFNSFFSSMKTKIPKDITETLVIIFKELN